MSGMVQDVPWYENFVHGSQIEELNSSKDEFINVEGTAAVTILSGNNSI